MSTDGARNTSARIQIPERPLSGRHAFIVTAFRDYGMLRRTLQLLDFDYNSIHLHVDSNSALPGSDVLGVVKRASLHLTPRVDVRWAGVSMVQAGLTATRSALQEADFDYIHLLTESDLPIRPMSEIHSFFREHSGFEFIEYHPDNDGFAQYKGQVFHFFANRRSYRSSKLTKYANHGLAKAQQKVQFQRHPGVRYYHGSAFWSITRGLAEYVDERADQILRDYRWTLAPDEVYLHTLVMNSPYRDRLYEFEIPMISSARYIDWARREGNSPHTITVEDLGEMLSNDGLMFARKFNPAVDSEVIDRVCERVLRHSA